MKHFKVSILRGLEASIPLIILVVDIVIMKKIVKQIDAECIEFSIAKLYEKLKFLLHIKFIAG